MRTVNPDWKPRLLFIFLLILTILALWLQGCSTVHKTYSKQISSTDSTGTTVNDSERVITDKSLITELKEGEYEKVTIELNHDTTNKAPIDNNTDTSLNLSLTNFVKSNNVKSITYERGKTKEQKTQQIDKQDSGTAKSVHSAEVKKEEKIINKQKDSERMGIGSQLAIGFGGLLLLLSTIAYLYWKFKK